ncbi:MAG TPA: SRPBCC family protein [Thermoanaerobaculia bacterium]|nr:SRPBCC family protein [Thermoanaerobaculia bacterium]
MGSVVVETFIRAPREIVFDLARDVEAHRQSSSFSQERVVPPGRLTGKLEAGDRVTFEGKHFGIRQRATAKITQMKRPEVFEDMLVESAFTWLRHVHEFIERDGGTLMIDRLEWRAPLGFLGRIADRLFVERHMRWFVATKQNALKTLAEQAQRI